MKRLLLVPTAIFPYIFCAYLFYGYISGAFTDNIGNVLQISISGCFAAAFVCNIIYMFASKKLTPEKIMKQAMIIKLIHISSYV